MENNPLPFAIKRTWLLRIYLVMPILLSVFLVDIIWYNQRLVFPYMGLSSLLLPLYLVVFELPHIIGSFLSFADKEYVQHYKRALVRGLPVVLIVVSALLYFNLQVAFVCYLVATVYHVIKQQTGIGLLLGAARGRWFVWWSYSGIIVTSLLYVFFILPELFPTNTLGLLNIAVLVGIVGFVVCGLVVRAKSVPKIARQYVVYTTLSLVLGYVFIMVGYLFLAFFLIRFIHDVTAFYFYIAHETNRNHQTVHNIIYQWLRHIPLPIFVLVPLISIGFAYALRVGITGPAAVYVVVILFGFVHYYLESMIWKKDALHRQVIQVQ